MLRNLTPDLLVTSAEPDQDNLHPNYKNCSVSLAPNIHTLPKLDARTGALMPEYPLVRYRVYDTETASGNMSVCGRLTKNGKIVPNVTVGSRAAEDTDLYVMAIPYSGRIYDHKVPDGVQIISYRRLSVDRDASGESGIPKNSIGAKCYNVMLFSFIIDKPVSDTYDFKFYAGTGKDANKHTYDMTAKVSTSVNFGVSMEYGQSAVFNGEFPDPTPYVFATLPVPERKPRFDKTEDRAESYFDNTPWNEKPSDRSRAKNYGTHRYGKFKK